MIMIVKHRLSYSTKMYKVLIFVVVILSKYPQEVRHSTDGALPKIASFYCNSTFSSGRQASR